MKYKFHFNNGDDSATFRDGAINLAEAFGRITVADLYDLVNEPTNNISNRIGWDKDTFINEVRVEFDPRSGSFIMITPELHIDMPGCPTGDKHIFVSKKKTTITTPEPFNITIFANSIKDPYTTIREVIRQANEIKDRPVLITIN